MNTSLRKGLLVVLYRVVKTAKVHEDLAAYPKGGGAGLLCQGHIDRCQCQRKVFLHILGRTKRRMEICAFLDANASRIIGNGLVEVAFPQPRIAPGVIAGDGPGRQA